MVSLATVAAGIQGAYVAVLAPSAGAAAVFPHMAAQGIRRLEECLGVPAKLMPSAELCGDALTPEVRAADINAAFADPKVVALVSTIGGDEGVRVLPFLDAGVIAANGHKPLLGYSDITSLHLYLWRLGVVSFYGGALLTQFAISGPGMHEYTRDAIRSALLRPSERYSLRASAGFQDGYLNWGDEANMGVAKALEPNLGWHWAGWQPGSPPVSGVLWGGCLEVLVGHFMSRKWTPGPILEERLRGAILFVETSEEFPAACFVYHFFQSLGEIGLLRREVGFAAVLMGRPQTVSGLTGSCGDRVAFKTEQQAAVLRAIAEYSGGDLGPPTPVVFGLDFGHTDPQCLVPSGGTAFIDSEQQTIEFSYVPDPRLLARSSSEAPAVVPSSAGTSKIASDGEGGQPALGSVLSSSTVS